MQYSTLNYLSEAGEIFVLRTPGTQRNGPVKVLLLTSINKVNIMGMYCLLYDILKYKTEIVYQHR